MKILVVEDEFFARKALVSQICAYDFGGDFQIFSVSNGKEALKIFYSERVDIIITDVRMPVMDGITLLKHIRETENSCKVIMLSAHSEFKYAKDAIRYGAEDYLIKPVDDNALQDCLNRCLKIQRTERNERMLSGRDMITKYLADSIYQEQHHNFVEKSLFEKVYQTYQIGILFFPWKCPEPTTFLDQIEGIRGSSFMTTFRFLQQGNGLWVILTVAEEDIRSFWTDMGTYLSKLGIEWRMGVSGVFYSGEKKTREEIMKQGSEQSPAAAYTEALHALKYKIYGKQNIYFVQDIKEEELPVYIIDPVREESLQHFLKEGNIERVRALVRIVFEELENLGMVRVKSLDLLYAQFVLACRKAIVDTEGLVLPSQSERNILFINSLNDFQSRILEMMEAVCEVTGKDILSGNEKLILQLVEYVEKHYQSDITLRYLADHVFFMNQDYLSHLFVGIKGMTFSSFLRKVRIHHAKEILFDQRTTVSEIASMVGYNDTSQFIRAFKQEVGVTPKQYRQKRMDR